MPLEILCLATNNAHKLDELRDVFQPLLPATRLLSLAEAAGGPVADAPEDEETFAGNALSKARFYAALVGVPVVADDSGLCVDCLDGRPGVRSARYAATTEERMARVLREVAEAERASLTPARRDAPFSRNARFVCAMARVATGEAPIVAEGSVAGTIRHEPLGEGGFGYDPIFFLPELWKTMAQLSSVEKNALSHRGRAARALAEKLKQPRR